MGSKSSVPSASYALCLLLKCFEDRILPCSLQVSVFRMKRFSVEYNLYFAGKQLRKQIICQLCCANNQATWCTLSWLTLWVYLKKSWDLGRLNLAGRSIFQSKTVVPPYIDHKRIKKGSLRWDRCTCERKLVSCAIPPFSSKGKCPTGSGRHVGEVYWQQGTALVAVHGPPVGRAERCVSWCGRAVLPGSSQHRELPRTAATRRLRRQLHGRDRPLAALWAAAEEHDAERVSAPRGGREEALGVAVFHQVFAACRLHGILQPQVGRQEVSGEEHGVDGKNDVQREALCEASRESMKFFFRYFTFW